MFPVLRLPNGKVVVPLRFASDRLLRVLDWTFHVLQLSNMSVVIPSCFCIRVLRSSTL